jgi:hypothetical protein
MSEEHGWLRLAMFLLHRAGGEVKIDAEAFEKFDAECGSPDTSIEHFHDLLKDTITIRLNAKRRPHVKLPFTYDPPLERPATRQGLRRDDSASPRNAG